MTSSRENENGRWHPGDMSITLEPEFYTAAFVSSLHLHQQRQPHERICGEAFFTLGMLAVAIMQCLTVFGMASYLSEKDAGYMDEFKLGTHLFATGGATMSMGHAKDLCGSFNHIGLNKLSGDNSLRMPDGTTFEGTPDMPMFHSYKMPSGSWTFHSIGGDESYIDKQLRVVHDVNWRDSFDYFRNFRVEYGVLLVIMVAWLWYHVLYEVRKIFKFVGVLQHLKSKGLLEKHEETTSLDPDSGQISITALTLNAYLVGYLSVIMRLAVALMMLIWGTSLLAASWNKLSLVLNSLAIGIVFELDVIIAYAVIDHNTMQRIENIEPIIVDSLSDRSSNYQVNLFGSIFMFVGVFVGAMLVRKGQVDSHVHELHNAAALCLFAGPTPQAYPEVMAPVPGFCESLLSLTCAPNVTGDGSRHGPCLITDANRFWDRSVMLYADDDIFEGMYDKNGKRQSMVDWGRASPEVLKTKTWQNDQHLNLFRRVCLQLYHPESKLDRRVVDPNLGLSMNSAPFYCPREQLFQAVFGGVKTNFNKWSSTLDLNSDDIVAALDRCHEPLQESPHKMPTSSQAPAPGPVAAFAPIPASSNLLRAARHHAHHQVQHRRTAHHNFLHAHKH